MGISLLYAVLFRAARCAINAGRPTALSSALGFLTRDFEVQFFAWELVEAWKKLVLVGFAALMYPGTLQQLLIAFLFSLMYLLVVGVASPWTSDLDDFVAKACGFATSAVFFFCIILKVETLTEELDEYFTRQLRRGFEFHEGVVAVGMPIACATAIACALLTTAD